MSETNQKIQTTSQVVKKKLKKFVLSRNYERINQYSIERISFSKHSVRI